MCPGLVEGMTSAACKVSGRERKILASARVLMLQPRVVIRDEPTSKLSPALARDGLEDHVKALADSGSAVLLVEQKAKEALAISDWAYVLVAGLVHRSEPAAELLAREDIREPFLGQVPGGKTR